MFQKRHTITAFKVNNLVVYVYSYLNLKWNLLLISCKSHSLLVLEFLIEIKNAIYLGHYD